MSDSRKLIMFDTTAAIGNTSFGTRTFLIRSPVPTIESAAYESDCEKKVHGISTLRIKIA